MRPDEPTPISFREAAARVIAIVESRGGRFYLRDDDTFTCAYDAIDFTEWPAMDAASLETVVRGLAADIGYWLLEQRRTTH